MDTTNRAGLADGSLGDGQFKWIERVLKGGTSRYYDTNGNLVRTSATDTLFILFSHHTSGTMGNTLPDATNLLETLSLFTTLIESDSPFETNFGDGSPTGLASLYREIAVNDLHADPARLGVPTDLNTELVLVKPF